MTATTTPTASSHPTQAAQSDRDKDRWEQTTPAAPDRDKDRWEINSPDRDKDRWEANSPDRDKDRWEAKAGEAMQRVLQPATVGRWLLALGTMTLGLGVLLLSRAACCQELPDAETLDGAVPAL